MDTKQAITRITNMMNIGGQIDDMAALQEKQERYNPKPLTKDELREYDGPVYIFGGYGYEGWLIWNDDIEEWVDCDNDNWDIDYYGMTGDGHLGLHNLGWLAYRTKPKGDADEV